VGCASTPNTPLLLPWCCWTDLQYTYIDIILQLFDTLASVPAPTLYCTMRHHVTPLLFPAATLGLHTSAPCCCQARPMPVALTSAAMMQPCPPVHQCDSVPQCQQRMAVTPPRTHMSYYILDYTPCASYRNVHPLGNVPCTVRRIGAVCI
jgi:hypothetical protein